MIEIPLPFPDAKLNPNRNKGTHWAATAKLRKKAREFAFWSTRGVMFNRLLEGRKVELAGDIPLEVIIIQPDKRQRDRDNLLAALKPSLDGIAHALGINDAQFEPVTVSRQFGCKPGSVIVRIG